MHTIFCFIPFNLIPRIHLWSGKPPSFLSGHIRIRKKFTLSSLIFSSSPSKLVFLFRDFFLHVKLLFKATLLKQGSLAFLIFQPTIFPSCCFYFALAITDLLYSFLFPHLVKRHTLSLLPAYKALNFPDPGALSQSCEYLIKKTRVNQVGVQWREWQYLERFVRRIQ